MGVAERRKRRSYKLQGDVGYGLDGEKMVETLQLRSLQLGTAAQ